MNALEQGVNSIDTARAYGESEEIVGRTLKKFKGPRPFIATKVAPLPTGNWRYYIPLEQAFTPKSMRESVEQSLKDLQVDCLDLLYLHQWYYLWTHRPEWLETFGDLKQEGKIRCFGISAQDHEHDALLQVVDMGLIDVAQIVFNIFESRPLTSFLPLAQAKNVGVIARCVLDDGGLSGLMTEERIAASSLRKGPTSAYIARIDKLTSELGNEADSLLELSLRFAITPAAVTSLTLSMQDNRFVESNLKALAKGPLSFETFEKLRLGHCWVKNFYYD